MNKIHYLLSLCLCLLLSFSLQAQDTKAHCATKKETPSCCSKAKASSTAKATFQLGDMTIPDLTLSNQHGEAVNFQELIKNKVVAMNFIFTTCTTICPPMGANFVKLQQLMGEHPGKDLAMISVSIDPNTDTPERLKAWSEKFKPSAEWTLLTGNQQEVNQLLKSLKVFTPLIEDHAPIMMIGKEGEDNWIRTNGLAQPDKLADILYDRLGVAKQVKQETKNPGQSYFTDTKLINQYGEEMAFYSDLLLNKVVLINPFFAECTGSCPAMHSTIKKIQDHLGDKLGTEVNMISITVDPKNDTPERLAAYAERFGAKKGWYFLSGDQANVDLIQGKLGKTVSSREEHDTIFLIGNVKTRLWKKVDGLAHPEKIIPLLEEVLNDKGA